MLYTNRSNPLELVGRHCGARGIGGKIQHHDLRAWRDGPFESLGTKHEMINSARGNGARHSTGKDDARAVGNVARLVVEHFVTRVQHGSQRNVDRLRYTDGNQDLAERLVMHSEMLSDILCNRASKTGQTEIGGVSGAPLFKGIDRCLPDMPWSRKVRLADSQRDHIVHALNDLKKVTDA